MQERNSSIFSLLTSYDVSYVSSASCAWTRACVCDPCAGLHSAPAQWLSDQRPTPSLNCSHKFKLTTTQISINIQKYLDVQRERRTVC